MKKILFVKQSITKDIVLELAFKGLPQPLGILETPSGEIILHYDDKVEDAKLEEIKEAIRPILTDRVFKRIIKE